ncbi:tyrosine-type recombinase/integrase [Klebsiella aerogenes]|nr:tyrosine-type recombinase/integrase [Klebsiella aerogenes]EIV7211118.1 tyrosine-type recombinase/integrase [Klebsiella aerogenes]EKZ5298605.1 tyrosine-type recombinase/integrase [Klebsiella aerogenes]HBQ0421841.1 tyrosine-type recombinase/integrase [Klebsiella aerogenes]
MAISDTKLRSMYGKPYTGPSELTDSDGLGIRITPKGVISFQFRYRWDGKQNRMGLGRYPAISLREARNLVADLRESLDKGVDPRLAKESSKPKSRPTVKECLDYWKKNYVDVTLREKTIALYESTVIKQMVNAFPGMPIEDIPVRLWVERFTEEERINPRRARHLLIQLRSAIGWCTRRQFIGTPELMLLQPKDVGIKPSIGETTLSYNQLAKVWMSIERSRGSTSNRLLHQLLILYGARNSELRLTVKKEVDREEGLWIVPAEKSKTKKIIRRPLFDAADTLLRKAEMTYGEVLFPGDDLKTPITISGANKFLRRIRGSLGIGEFSSHDFRRTMATRLSEEGVAPHVIEKMLGHELGGVLSVYNKHDWIAEQKDAYNLYAEKIFWHIKKISG